MKASCPDCNVLAGNRWHLDAKCEACDGKGGSVEYGMCSDCCGTGFTLCPTCDGTGYVEPAPNVSSEASATEDAR